MYLKKCDHCGTMMDADYGGARDGTVRFTWNGPDGFKSCEADLCKNCFDQLIHIVKCSSMIDILKEDLS